MSLFLKIVLRKFNLNGSCSVIMSGIFFVLAAKKANRPLAGFHRFAWIRSIFSSFIMSLRSFSCLVSFL